MAISIVINGIETPVTKQELFDMAKRGSISPDTVIIVNGVRSTAGRVQGIDFGTAATTHEKHDTRYEILLHNIPATVTREQLFDLAAKGIINPDTPVTVNGKLGTASMIDGIDFGIVFVEKLDDKSEHQQQSAYHQTATTTKSRCISIGLLLMVLCAIVCGVGYNMDQANGELARNLDTGQRSINIANRNLNRGGYTDENVREAMNAIDQQRQSRMSMERNSYSPDAILACYTLGGTGFVIGFVLFIVGLILPGSVIKTKPRKAIPLVLETPRTARVRARSGIVYVLDISDTRPLILMLEGYNALNRLRIYVKYGSPPRSRLDDCHYISNGTTEQSITIGKPSTGRYYITIVSLNVLRSCRCTLTATQSS